MKKRKWLRRILLLTATFMLVLLGGVMVAMWLARSQPAFYRPLTLTVQERAQAAQSAEEKFIRIQNRAAQISAAESAARRNGSASTTPIVLNGEPVTISFTDAELNSFFEKWSNFQNWKSKYEPYLEDPAIILQDGRLIVAGQLKEPRLVVSLHFEPSIDEQGRLRMELAQILGGRLPLPETMVAKHRDKLTASLQQKLPAWQHEAKIDPTTGAANTSAIAASATKLLINVLEHEPAEPVTFLPVFGQSGSVPVKIRDVKIADGSLTVTVLPMTRSEQTALLERIRSNSVETTSAR